MTLSRLASIRPQKRLVSRQPRKRPHNNQRYARLAEAIRRTKDELDTWDRQVLVVERLFNQHILPREQRMTREVSEIVNRLINDYQTRRLEDQSRSLLHLWISDYLQFLQEHPFADQQTNACLLAQWQMVSRPADLSYATQSANLRTSHQAKNDVEFDEQPSDVGFKPDCTDERYERDRTDPHPDQPGQDQASAASTHKSTARETTAGLSAEKLFRQLAAVLHPDREQDESVKSEKHNLMSLCLKARQENDLSTLLQLYTDYITDKEFVSVIDKQALVRELERQLNTLQLALRNRRFGNPLRTLITERYAAGNESAQTALIGKHARSLDNTIQQLMALKQSLSTYAGLQNALNKRQSIEMDRVTIDELTGIC